MKFGVFQSLRLKKEKSELNTKGFFIKSQSINAKILEKNENKAIFIITKKIGNAPKRNKIKRKIRAILSSIKKTNLKVHILIIVKQEINLITFQQLKNEIIKLFQQIYKKLHKLNNKY